MLKLSKGKRKQKLLKGKINGFSVLLKISKEELTQKNRNRYKSFLKRFKRYIDKHGILLGRDWNKVAGYVYSCNKKKIRISDADIKSCIKAYYDKIGGDVPPEGEGDEPHFPPSFFEPFSYWEIDEKIVSIPYMDINIRVLGDLSAIELFKREDYSYNTTFKDKVDTLNGEGENEDYLAWVAEVVFEQEEWRVIIKEEGTTEDDYTEQGDDGKQKPTDKEDVKPITQIESETKIRQESTVAREAEKKLLVSLSDALDKRLEKAKEHLYFLQAQKQDTTEQFKHIGELSNEIASTNRRLGVLKKEGKTKSPQK